MCVVGGINAREGSVFFHTNFRSASLIEPETNELAPLLN